MKIQPTDSFSSLLQTWQPKPRQVDCEFVSQTMQRIRSQSPISLGEKWEIWVEQWFPKPEFLLPLAACLVVMIGGKFWIDFHQLQESRMALDWHQTLTAPLSKTSIAGTYFQQTQGGF